MKDFLRKNLWIVFTLTTVIAWGIWGAIIELSKLPPTLGYVVWAATMIPCAVVAMGINKWAFDFKAKSLLWGSLVGLTGAGGQLLLFQALREGPAFIVFPIVSLYPVLTIALAVLLLREQANRIQLIGIVLALIAILLLSTTSGSLTTTDGFLWLLLSIGVFLMWGFQAFAMKFANLSMKAEDIFFYMTLTSLLFIPVALAMTDFDAQSNWSLTEFTKTFLIQILNSVGALTLVYALRFGKAILVVPLSGFAPAITVILSLAIYKVWPSELLIVGIVLSVTATYLFSKE